MTSGEQRDQPTPDADELADRLRASSFESTPGTGGASDDDFQPDDTGATGTLGDEGSGRAGGEG